MDVVSDARAVSGGVIVAKNRQVRILSDGRLGYKRQKVIGFSNRELANKRRRMRANWIEITEVHEFDLGRTAVKISNDLLAHPFGVAIW